ncbi:MAG: hypothetical protein AAB150_18630 [Pseudomonadota bacterium]
MKTRIMIIAGALAFALSAGQAQARIPVAPMDDAAKAQAEEKKAKAAEAGKKAAELLAKAQDRVVERYKKEQSKSGKLAPAAKK